MPWQLARRAHFAAGFLLVLTLLCVVVPLETPAFAPWAPIFRGPLADRIAVAQLALSAASILAVAVVLLLSIAPAQRLEFRLTRSELLGNLSLSMGIRSGGAALENLKLELWLDQSMPTSELVRAAYSGWVPVAIKFGPTETLYGWTYEVARAYVGEYIGHFSAELPLGREQPRLLIRWWADRSGPNVVSVSPDAVGEGNWTRGTPTTDHVPFSAW